MKCIVNNEIRLQSDKCRNGYMCQALGGKPHCQISDSVNGLVFFLKCSNPLDCPYQHAFGSSFMCTCPVRQEVYREYRI